MRKLFANLLKDEIKNNKNIYLLLGGVGYGFFEPDGKQIINCEASEQAMVDIAVGLASSGKVPFVYAVTPHLYRAFEGIRIYLNHYQIPVKLVGVGRDKDYTTLGFTHWAEDAKKIFDTMDLIQKWPEKADEIPDMLDEVISNNKPYFISLPR